MDQELREVLKGLEDKVDKMGFQLGGMAEGKTKVKGLMDRSRKGSSERSDRSSKESSERSIMSSNISASKGTTTNDNMQ